VRKATIILAMAVGFNGTLSAQVVKPVADGFFTPKAPDKKDPLPAQPPAQWNTRPRDLARLMTWMGQKYEKLYNWQVMRIDRSVEELLDAPILLVSGKAALSFTDEQKSKLREYILGGGVLFGEAAGGGAAGKRFSESFEKLCGELFEPLAQANPPFLADATDDGQAAMRHVDGLPRAPRPIPLTGYQPKEGKWGVLLLSCDLTAALAGYPSFDVSGLTPAAAEKFMAALLKSIAGN